jgi:endonuclease/exonuclease/phosphatase family metal-dependent hydrolase
MTPLKLMSWNIQEGGGGRLASIAALVRTHNPDCVALLEVDSLRNAEALASELRMTLTFGESNCPSGVAWLTAQPPVRAENHRLPQLAKTLLELELDYDGAQLRLFATHLGSRWNIQQPVDEIVTVLQVLEQRGGDRHVLAGDLNALRPGDPVGTPPRGEARRGDAIDGAQRLTIGRILDAGYVDCFRHMHAHRRGFTYPSQAPWLRLDYIFASAGLAPHVHRCDAIDTRLARRASDHLPVVASFHAPRADVQLRRRRVVIRALIKGEKWPT